jgi:hypothetical protein
MNGLSNGVGHVTLNGKPAAENDKAEAEAEEEQDPDKTVYKPGMKNGLKQLYSGKEDKKGRFQWQNTIPKDIGEAAENDKTAKWALLVRNVKVYNDPRRVLSIHSIVVQSPLLKKLLMSVLKGYPGVTVGLNRLEFEGKFEPLIHRWAELQEAISKLSDETGDQPAVEVPAKCNGVEEQEASRKLGEEAEVQQPAEAVAEGNGVDDQEATSQLEKEAEDRRTTKAHAELLQEVLVKEFKTLIDSSQDMKSKRVMTYEHLWTLFQPGSTVFTRQDGQESAMTLVESRYAMDAKGNPCYCVTSKYVDWDGSKFGTTKMNLLIYPYNGTRPISSLLVYPLEYHPDGTALRERLIARGTKAEQLAGPNYRAYQGVAWKHNPNTGAKDKYNITGRIVIDTYGWNRFNPSYSIFTSNLEQKKVATDGTDPDPEAADDEPCDDDGSGMPLNGAFTDAPSLTPLTTLQKLTLSPLLRGYSLKSKLWLNFFVTCVNDISWQTDAFDRLVLPSNTKDLILGFTQSQRTHRDTFDDVIEGKGRGMIILLCGPPGVGKTLTAESMAEEMQVPLYMMSAGDLGFDPRKVEQKLQDILEMCSRWNAILLLDEADVFLEQRSLHELERNKLVSIFLRVLEYYEGTMFLTTNRVNTFDPAFQSRIHISLNYEELSSESRRTVWKNFIDSSTQEHSIGAKELDELARMNVNGRQIKNILKIARLLASRKEEKLNHGHIMTTLDVTQHLHNENMASKRTQGSLYG